MESERVFIPDNFDDWDIAAFPDVVASAASTVADTVLNGGSNGGGGGGGGGTGSPLTPPLPGAGPAGRERVAGFLIRWLFSFSEADRAVVRHPLVKRMSHH